MSLGHYNSLRSHQSCGVFMSDGLFGWIRFLEKHLRDGLQAAEPGCRALDVKVSLQLIQHTCFLLCFYMILIDMTYKT